MDIQLADVTLHVDEALGAEERNSLVEQLRAMDGVVSVSNPDAKPHLTIVEYNPASIKADQLLEKVRSNGVHAELIGL